MLEEKREQIKRNMQWNVYYLEERIWNTFIGIAMNVAWNEENRINLRHEEKKKNTEQYDVIAHYHTIRNESNRMAASQCGGTVRMLDEWTNIIFVASNNSEGAFYNRSTHVYMFIIDRSIESARGNSPFNQLWHCRSIWIMIIVRVSHFNEEKRKDDEEQKENLEI